MRPSLDITAIASEIGIDDTEADLRKAYLELGDTDGQLLREASSHLLSYQDQFTDGFYAHLDAFGEMRALLSAGQTRNNLKRTLADYFGLLMSGDYGRDYVLNRLRVGLAHQRVGLEPKWYIGAYRKQLSSLLPFIRDYCGDDAEKLVAMVEALLKVVFFDMMLAMDTYIYADRQAILQLEKHIRELVQGIDAIVWEADLDSGKYKFVSTQSLAILGYEPERWLADADFWRAIMVPEDRLSTVSIRQAEIHAGRDHELDYRVRGADGGIVWIRERINLVRGQDGKLASLRGFMLDITGRRQAEEKLVYFATHDELTNLPNRTLLQDRIDQGIAQITRQGGLLALMFIDLDRFKNINDSLGHDIGDAVLRIATERLLGCVREVDTVARLGGDEFIVLLNGISRMDDISLVSQKVLAALNHPFHVDDHELAVSGSIGISVCPKDGRNMQTLLKNADIAMYRAKDLGKNRVQFFTEEMNAVAVQRLFVENQLQQALERGEFVVYYQPKVNLKTGAISGAEALVRWDHPQQGLIPPADFIPIAEETGIIVKLGQWVLETACRQARAWQQAGFKNLRIAVNLSARQLVQDDLVDTVVRVLQAAGLDPGLLELELTESMLIRNAETAITTLDRLRRLGIHLSLDDFGTGYSALGYLNRFPLSSVKIDRSFVADVTTDPHATALTRSIISMAHELRMTVVAEGVETEGQLSFLASRDCDEVQGYYVSRPLPAEQFATLLREFGGLKLDRSVLAGALKRSLLIVDDDAAVIGALRRVLDADGFRILAASSGREGLELLAIHPVAVIISNQNMPGMCGEEFLQRVKALYPKAVRILLSGSADLMSVTNAINQGAIHKFLIKPWQDDLLRTHIHEAFKCYELEQKNLKLSIELEQANRELEQHVEEKTQNLRQSLQALQLSQEIFEWLPMAVIGVDATGLIVLVNHAADEIFTAETGVPLSGAIGTDQLPAPLAECRNEVLANGICSHRNRPVVLPSGRKVRIACHRLDKHCHSKGALLVVTQDE